MHFDLNKLTSAHYLKSEIISAVSSFLPTLEKTCVAAIYKDYTAKNLATLSIIYQKDFYGQKINTSCEQGDELTLNGPQYAAKKLRIALNSMNEGLKHPEMVYALTQAYSMIYADDIKASSSEGADLSAIIEEASYISGYHLGKNKKQIIDQAMKKTIVPDNVIARHVYN